MEALVSFKHDPGERVLHAVAAHCLDRRRLEGYTPQVRQGDQSRPNIIPPHQPTKPPTQPNSIQQTKPTQELCTLLYALARLHYHPGDRWLGKWVEQARTKTWIVYMYVSINITALFFSPKSEPS